VRRAAWDLEVNGNDVAHGPGDTVSALEHAAVPSAVADGDNHPRVRDGIESLAERSDHVVGYGPGDEETVGVTGRGFEPDTELLGVIVGGEDRGDLELAPVAGARVDVAKL
jgi:hypothetical protein